MQVVKEVNNISDKIRPRRLEKGEVVRYKVYIGTPNTDQDTKEKYPFIYPALFQIPSVDRIYDPGKRDGEGDYVDIALIQSSKADGEFTTRPIWVERIDRGYISCTGGRREDQELFEHLELVNYNKSNEIRDQSIEPLFERVDVIGDSKNRKKNRSLRLEAMQFAQNMTDGDVKRFAASLTWDENENIDVLRDRVEAMAEKEPEEFTKIAGSKDVDIKATVKKALDLGAISYDPQQRRILTSSGELLIVLPATQDTGKDAHLTQAAEYIQHSKKGQAAYNTIKKLAGEKAGDPS